jgi:hypothetical protein
MKVWEIDVEMRVRKTLIISGPETADAARTIVAACTDGGMPWSTFQKWLALDPHKISPVEVVLDNDPQIVAVRDVTGRSGL